MTPMSTYMVRLGNDWVLGNGTNERSRRRSTKREAAASEQQQHRNNNHPQPRQQRPRQPRGGSPLTHHFELPISRSRQGGQLRLAWTLKRCAFDNFFFVVVAGQRARPAEKACLALVFLGRGPAGLPSPTLKRWVRQRIENESLGIKSVERETARLAGLVVSDQRSGQR